ncbi:hypothetical protein ACPEEZ_06910 [Frigoribacterium sp. 2-23]|uniref:hypothetical protein n=1 Tax=Frigoribacterium sp. 2-23 TaxID=3415006 RepID=UPI003C6FA429
MRDEASEAFGTLNADPAKRQALIDSFATMRRSNSGLTWLRKPETHALLARLREMHGPLDHAHLDSLDGAARSVEYVRALFIEHELLPRRDRYLEEFAVWSRGRELQVTDPDARLVMRQFLEWGQRRRLRRSAEENGGEASLGAFLSVKQTTTVTIQFLNSVCGDGLAVADIDQHDLDNWFAAGPSTRELATGFLYWAMNRKLMPRLTLPRRNGFDIVGAESSDRFAVLARVLEDEQLPQVVRVATVMIALFGQPVGRTVALPYDAVRVDSNGDLEIIFSHDLVPVPPAFAVILDGWIKNRPHLQTAAHRDSPWLFTGTTPGRHIQANTISAAMAKHGISPRSVRAAAWRDLIRHMPTPLLSSAFGVSAARLDAYAKDAGSRFARYAAMSGRGQ